MSEQSANDASSYFLTEPGAEPTAAGRFVNLADVENVTFLQGLTFQPVLGENVLVNHVHFAPGTEAPTHVHEEEQVVVVVDGEFEFWIDGESRTLRRGDIAVVPPWVSHGARTHDSECLEIDIFSPPRRQLLDLLRPADQAAQA